MADMADAGKLFVPFQRLEEKAGFAGHGIGLATVERTSGATAGWYGPKGKSAGARLVIIRCNLVKQSEAR